MSDGLSPWTLSTASIPLAIKNKSNFFPLLYVWITCNHHKHHNVIYFSLLECVLAQETTSKKSCTVRSTIVFYPKHWIFTNAFFFFFFLVEAHYIPFATAQCCLTQQKYTQIVLHRSISSSSASAKRGAETRFLPSAFLWLFWPLSSQKCFQKMTCKELPGPWLTHAMKLQNDTSPTNFPIHIHKAFMTLQNQVTARN